MVIDMLQKSWADYIKASKLLKFPNTGFGIKNLKYEYAWVDDLFCNYTGIEDCNQDLQTIHTNPNSLFGRFERFQLNSEDAECISNALHLEIFCGAYVKNKYKLLLCNKSPIINPETSKVEGIWVSLEPFNWMSRQDFLKIASKQLEDSFLKYKTQFPTQFQLTQREEVILFLLLMGYSVQQITTILAESFQVYISYNTVKNIIANQLRPKFKAKTMEELIQIASQQGLNNIIPERIVGEFRLITKRTPVSS